MDGSSRSVIGGGSGNYVLGGGATSVIAGGNNGTIETNASAAVIGGGTGNRIGASSVGATVPGGRNNTASNNFTFAAGNQAKAVHSGTFVWNDAQAGDFTSTGFNQFLIHAAGGVGINTNNPQSALHVAGTVTATNFSGPGLGLTSLNGAALTASSVNNAALAAGAVTGDKIATGTLSHLDAPDGTPVNAMQVSSNGLLGVGTTSPQAALHIASSVPSMVPSVLSRIPYGTGSYTNFSVNRHAFLGSNLMAVVDWVYGSFTLVDVSSPASPVFRSSVVDGTGSFTNLEGARSAAFWGNLMAVGSPTASAVTLVDVSTPAAPVWRSVLRDEVGVFTNLAGVNALAMSTNLLVAASSTDHAVTLVNVTTPASPSRYSTLLNGVGGFNYLSAPTALALSGNLLVVSSPADNAVSLINVANRSVPALYATLVDGVGGFNYLSNVTAVAFSGNLLALVSPQIPGDCAVTLVNVANPAAPQLLATLTNPLPGYPLTFSPRSVDFQGNYLLITGGGDNDLMIVDVSTPSAPVFHTYVREGFNGFYTFTNPETSVKGTTLVVNTWDHIYMVDLTSSQPVGLVSENWVGIGTTTPLAPLHVRGDVLVESADTVTLMADHFTLGRGDASGQGSLAVGGYASASGDYSVAIGTATKASGHDAYALGRSAHAEGNYSMALGRYSQALHDGTFVWSDGQNAYQSSTGANQFLIRAAGGVGINTNNPQSALHVVGTVTADNFVGSGSALTGVAQLGSNQTFTGTASFNPVSGAPFTVGSTNKITNLNADLLDGLDSTNFALLGASQTFSGRPAFNGGVSGASSPFTVGSTNTVTNLNADLLDGFHAASFASASHDHYGDAWTGSAAKGLSVQTAATGGGVAALHGQEGTGSGSMFSKAAIWGDSTNGYGMVGSTYSSVAVLGFAGSSTGLVQGVRGESASASGRGVSGSAFATSGTNYGVYGSSASTNGVGVYGTAPTNGGVAIKAAGSGVIQSSADSYVFVPGNVMVKNLSTDTTHWDMQAGGAARIWGGTNFGSKTVYFPVTLPAVLYGQPVTVSEVAVYYRCTNNTTAYITGTYVDKLTTAASSVSLVADSTARTNTTATSYALSPASNNVLSADQGTLGFYLMLNFANDTDWVQIGGIRFKLKHE